VYPLFVSLHLAYPISISPVCPPRPGPYGAAQEVERITQVAWCWLLELIDIIIKDILLPSISPKFYIVRLAEAPSIINKVELVEEAQHLAVAVEEPRAG
jgi:hypothetical protein